MSENHDEGSSALHVTDPPHHSEHSGSTPRRRVLLISYTFPPVGGAGVQRVTKFVKYLPQCGWDVTVLTVANPSVPLTDESLCQDIPGGTEIRRARTWEPGYGLKSAMVSTSGEARPSLVQTAKKIARGVVRSSVNTLLQPDPQVLWRPGAVAEGARALRSAKYDAIFASGPPFSTFLLATSLARRFQLPLVLDYRDEWDISNRYWENKRLGPWSLAVQKRMQRHVLHQASAVIATTEASAASLRDLCQQARSSAKVLCIYNGFDREDFLDGDSESGLGVKGQTGVSSSEYPAAAESLTPTATEPLRLTYVGTLWALTTIQPVADAVRQLVTRSPELKSLFRLVIAGRRTEGEQAIVDALQRQTGVVQPHDYISHTDAVRLMGQASELLVLLSDLPGVGRVLPAKVFEYLATGRPILAVAPHGELWKVLERFPHVRLFEPSQVSEMSDYLAARIRGEVTFPSNARQEVFDSGYDRLTQTGQLGGLLEEVAHV